VRDKIQEFISTRLPKLLESQLTKRIQPDDRSFAMNSQLTGESVSDEKPVVLFLCTRNLARSQIAEAWLHELAGDRFHATSAGLVPAEIHPLTNQVMAEVGISLDEHRSKPISEFLGRVAVRHMIVVCANAEKNCPGIWPFGGQLEYLPFDDPASPELAEFEQLVKFREVRDSIERQIRKWISEAGIAD